MCKSSRHRGTERQNSLSWRSWIQNKPLQSRALSTLSEYGVQIRNYEHTEAQASIIYRPFSKTKIGHRGSENGQAHRMGMFDHSCNGEELQGASSNQKIEALDIFITGKVVSSASGGWKTTRKKKSKDRHRTPHQASLAAPRGREAVPRR
ncbi:conserved hypothetical protein [Coccidioides posadasii str. Silveira]|uniref:Uncharacterized protein n=1 Tax=Coccidioides posadasii (strain RMSCC 757 / Silveira) TaxID=443226 RepID=E9D1P6_COCPS|nr:conserved hypothetical protein [Coccidioides posadasii str. Silveira]